MTRLSLVVGLTLLAAAVSTAQPPPHRTTYEFVGVLHVAGAPDVQVRAGAVLPHDGAFATVRHGLLDPDADHSVLTEGLELTWFVARVGDELNLEVHAEVESRTEPPDAPKTTKSRIGLHRTTFTKRLPLSGENVTLFTSKDSHYELVLERFGPIP